jgi:AraC family transcriptional regulator, ethanolamine operon transcriptional activator
MLFQRLSPSPALELQRYTDLDHFFESERYVGAESIPLQVREFSARRATLSMPSCRLSLVRTFPRIITGHELSGRLLVVIPMDGVCSTRVNGRAIGQSVIVMKGKANCRVLEPESRLVSILSIDAATVRQSWLDFDNGHLLLDLPAAALERLQQLISGTLEYAARRDCPGAAEPAKAAMLQGIEDRLLAGLNAALACAQKSESRGSESLDRYKIIVDRVDELVELSPIDLSNEKLACAVGVSVRTLQKAAFSVCGSGIYHYSRLKRLWSVRHQLRTGAPGLTVKASAMAHGFWHQSEFSNAYRAAFGELPSRTLEQARKGKD